MSDRSVLLQAFLAAHGWGTAHQECLAGDASERRYHRLSRGHDRAIVMDSPPGQADDLMTFVAVAAYLRAAGLSVPDVLAQDVTVGFALLEDFGDTNFAHVLSAAPETEEELYLAATQAILHLQSAAPKPGLAQLSAGDWAEAAMLALEWYGFGVTGVRCDTGALRGALADTLARHADQACVMVHRDYHAANLMWLPDRIGLRRAGLLDFQMLQMGQPVYDLVSLLQDARRDVGHDTAETSKRYFCMQTGTTMADLSATYAAVGAQRALRIIGIFARLCMTAGKTQYVSLIPRVWGHLQTNLAHPALRDLRRICDRDVPEPTARALAALHDKSKLVRG